MELLTSGITLHPNFYFLYDYRAFALDRLDRHEEAWEDMSKSYELHENRLMLAFLAYLAGRSGRTEKALELYEELKQARRAGTGLNLGLALAAIGVGRPDEAFEHLERCYESHEPSLRFITAGFGFEHLWDDPRFDVLRSKMGLPDPLATTETVNR